MSLIDNCSPKLITVDETTGCTLTRASISAWTSQDVEDLGLKEVGMDRIIAQTKELRMTGVKQRAMTDLFMSRIRPGKAGTLGGNQNGAGGSIISPFTLVPQRSVVNSNNFVIESAAADDAAGTTVSGIVHHSGAWTIKVINEAGQFATTLSELQRYFLRGKFVTVFTLDPVTGAHRRLQFKVIDSHNADAGGVSKATIDLAPPYSEDGWADLTSDEKAVYNPTTGVVINMANSVSNYESWCYQYPAVNTLKLRDFWWQTVRSTWAYDDQYIKALQAPLTGTWFQKFRTLSIAEQRKQQGDMEERDLFNTLMHGQRANENQTDTRYKFLDQVVDPANPTCLIEYKSNTLGYETQLAECGRVIDMNGAALDIDMIKALLYAMRRHRGLDGMVEIDAFGDRFTYVLWQTAFLAYVKDRYGLETTRFYTPGQKLTFQNQVLWNYDKFEFPEDGVIVNFFHDDAFDDFLSAFPQDIKAAGRQLLFPDWSDFNVAMAGAQSVNRQTNIADNLYNCVITPNVTHYQLQSKTIQCQLGDPNRHLMIRNFSDECPILTASPCTAAS